MTRKDYEAMAQAFRQALQARLARVDGYERQAACDGFADAVHVAASVFAADNPRFDRERFLKACGVQS